MGQWQRRKVSKGTSEPVNSEPDKSIQQDAAPPIISGSGEIADESWLEVDRVEAMVEGVKSRGVSCILFHGDEP